MLLATPVVRVASVPSGHPYVRNVLAGGAFDLLPDPVPAGASDGRWWPPVMCDPAWVTANRNDFDVMHLHFGTESFPVRQLRSFVRALQSTGRPLVYTLHDLQNPQLSDQQRHEEHLDLLVPSAAAVLTLTAGAAAEIERRWGRSPVVVPHPHVLALDAAVPIGVVSPQRVLGVHLRDIRPGIDAVRAVTTVLAAVDQLRARGVAAVARVQVNERVRDEAARDAVTALVAAHPGAELLRTERLDDNALARSIADLDVAVLPYRTGTHSGWVELCWDLGVPVAGPRVGYAGEQHPHDFAAFEAGDPGTLASAVQRLLTGSPRPGTAGRAERTAQRRRQRVAGAAAIAAAHTAVYEQVLTPVERAA